MGVPPPAIDLDYSRQEKLSLMEVPKNLLKCLLAQSFVSKLPEITCSF